MVLLNVVSETKKSRYLGSSTEPFRGFLELQRSSIGFRICINVFNEGFFPGIQGKILDQSEAGNENDKTHKAVS